MWTRWSLFFCCSLKLENRRSVSHVRGRIWDLSLFISVSRVSPVLLCLPVCLSPCWRKVTDSHVRKITTQKHLSTPDTSPSLSANTKGCVKNKSMMWIQFLGRRGDACQNMWKLDCFQALKDGGKGGDRGRGNEGSNGWIKQRDILWNYFPNVRIPEATASQSNQVCTCCVGL